MTKPVSLKDRIGKGYNAFWHSKHRYRVVKGSRGSKKSKNTAQWYILNLMKHPEANLLVVRKVFRTLKDSCYSDLQWAVNRLHVAHLWHFTISPLEATYLPTGQKIFFRGLDDPLKIASISVPKGSLCWMWIEEAYEIMHESDFDMLDESIRGELPEGLFKQITLTFNPWSERHWIKGRFFDAVSPDVFASTTDYTMNEWLDDADRKLFEDMKVRNPRRFNVAGLGNWGIIEGLVYESWREEKYNLDSLPADSICLAGLDYGYTNDPAAFIVLFYSEKMRQIYIWDEFYKKGMSNRAIYQEIVRMGYSKEAITGDSSEQKSNADLRAMGLRITGALKGADSVNRGIQFIQDLEIIVHPRCTNFINEISNYGFQADKFGQLTNKPSDDDNHLMDALRYALERHIRATQKIDLQSQINAVKRLRL